MSAVDYSLLAQLAVQTKQWARNTKQPVAEFQNVLAGTANHAAFVRSKPLFSHCCKLTAIPTSAIGTRYRWRVAYHAGPFAQQLRVVMMAARQNSGAAADCYVRMRLTTATGAVIGDAIRHLGSSATAGTDVPSEWINTTVTLHSTTAATVLVDVVPDTDYFLEFADVNYARLISAAVWEVSLAPDTDNAYVQANAGSGAPIYDNARGDVSLMGRKLWRRHASQLWNWTSEQDSAAPSIVASASVRNLIDDTSTTVSSATPGATLDMRQRSTMRLASVGVPVVMYIHATSTTAGDSGTVRLVNSAGATVLSVAVTATAATWYRAVGYLPATEAKYDLHYGGNTTGTMVVYAVSIYEYEHTAQEVTADGPAQVRIAAFDATSSLA